MKHHWSPRAAAGLSARDALVYRSRLIGDEEALGLFGGGNTSTKCRAPDLSGALEDVLWVKGSGSNLKGCEPRHFAPLRLAPLQGLLARRQMSDDEMVACLERCLIDPKAPRPSVETLLHAFIPHPDIDHTHADAILALANTPNGAALVRRVLGPKLLWIPYIQPGFALSRRVAEAYRRNPDAEGAVLEQHGLITWGSDGRISYGRTIAYVSRAERFLAQLRRRRVWSAAASRALPPAHREALLEAWLPILRHGISRQRKMHLAFWDDADVLEFVNARRLPEVSRIGPATPDHMLRTKRLPLILRPVGPPSTAAQEIRRHLDRYAAEHRRYFARYHQPGQTLQDPSPRVILMPGVGMLTTGKDATDAGMVATIYRHAMRIMRDATRAGGYTAVTAREAFGVEYWPLELYKLSLAPPEAELSREIVLITGATGGIGRAIAELLVNRGATVVVTDLSRRAVEQLADALNRRAGRRRALGVALDVTREASIAQAFARARRVFGGLDAVVSNAGIAMVASIDRLSLQQWERSLAVNATGHFLVARAAVRWLRAQGLGGSLVFISSKNVPAPGKDFGAYSAAKAAETQLARVLAIENGEHGIRVNLVNPDGVFEGSGLWQTIAPDRARSYGVAPQALEVFYQQRNLLRAKVLPSDVAEAVAFLISRRSAKTTGCFLPVDGGLREAFPR
ncbi:MAG: bifunctional rhamnulose-1-phosphate aldolase/short-chain dehydrogenase [Candidatus Omnitrophica bacterium]|nr:bifunctional rhamnulose-1-phosphate aldolase/short-chain dehydrogenase [Candidatus Omnitrophota bacterium]